MHFVDEIDYARLALFHFVLDVFLRQGKYC